MAILNTHILAAVLSRSNQLRTEEDGHSIVEYTMMLVLMALSVFLAGPDITSSIVGVFTNTSSLLVEAMG